MFNNLIGLKPSLGRLPSTGVVPACRTLDTVSVFALTAADAAVVLAAAQGPDPQDAYSRSLPPHGRNFGSGAFRFGLPRGHDLEFYGNAQGLAHFSQAVGLLIALGGVPVEIDLTPFRSVATLLYEGPWVAERYTAIRTFIETQPESLHPVTRAITEAGGRISAADTFAALYRLKALEQTARAAWGDIDCLVVPTAPTIHTIVAVEADPIALNSQLGHYTNFVNLLDLSAVAVPVGFATDGPARGLPHGVTLIARCGQDLPLLTLAARLHAGSVSTVGATSHAPHRGAELPDTTPFPSGQVQVAVCGAHLSGLPLNWQLTQRGATLVRSVRSAPLYKFYALPGGPPFRPGMVRVTEGGGAIELEVWELPAREFGSFVAGIPAPLGIGTVLLEDGTSVQGFVCESHAVAQAEDITALGGWRAHLARAA
jgi:allophanate hydrolase